MDADVVVVFARAVGLGAHASDVVRVVYRGRDDGNRRTLFGRSGRGVSLCAVLAGDVCDGTEMERFAAAGAVCVRPGDAAGLALGASLLAASVLVFGGDSVDPLRTDDWR